MYIYQYTYGLKLYTLSRYLYILFIRYRKYLKTISVQMYKRLKIEKLIPDLESNGNPKNQFNF